MSDSVSIVDLDAFTVLGEAPVGRDPVDIDGPRHIALDERAGLAYVALSYPNDTVGPHAAQAGKTERPGYLLALALDDLRPVGEQRIEPNAEDIAFSPSRDELVVTHNDTLRALQETELEARRAAIDFVRPASGMANRAARAHPSKVCVAPTTIVYGGADDSRAFIACTGEDDLTVVDTTTAQVLARIPAGEGAANQPYALTVDPSGEWLAVSNRVSRALSLFRVGDEPELQSVTYLNGVPYFAAWLSATEVVVPVQDVNGAAVVDPTTGMVQKEVSYSRDVCENPSEAVPLPGGRLVIVCEGDHYSPGSIVQVDPATLEITARVEVGNYPDRLALRPPAP